MKQRVGNNISMSTTATNTAGAADFDKFYNEAVAKANGGAATLVDKNKKENDFDLEYGQRLNRELQANPDNKEIGDAYEKHMADYYKRNPEALKRFSNEYIPDNLGSAKESLKKTGSAIGGMALSASKRIGEASQQVIQHPVDALTSAASGTLAGAASLVPMGLNALGGVKQQIVASIGDYEGAAKIARERAQDEAKSARWINNNIKSLNTGGPDNPMADVAEVVAPMFIPAGVAGKATARVLTEEQSTAAAAKALSGRTGLSRVAMSAADLKTGGMASRVADLLSDKPSGYAFRSAAEVNREITLRTGEVAEAIQDIKLANSAQDLKALNIANAKYVRAQNALDEATRANLSVEKELAKQTSKLQPTALGTTIKQGTAGGVLGAGYGGLTGAPGSDKTQPAVAGATFGAGAALVPRATALGAKAKDYVTKEARGLGDEWRKDWDAGPFNFKARDVVEEVPTEARNVTPSSARDVPSSQPPPQKLLRDGKPVETPAPEVVVEQPKPAAPVVAAAAAPAAAAKSTEAAPVATEAPAAKPAPVAESPNPAAPPVERPQNYVAGSFKDFVANKVAVMSGDPVGAPRNSANGEFASYDAKTSVMAVQFKGRTYYFQNVPKDIYEGYINSHKNVAEVDGQALLDQAKSLGIDVDKKSMVSEDILAGDKKAIEKLRGKITSAGTYFNNNIRGKFKSESYSDTLEGVANMPEVEKPSALATMQAPVEAVTKPLAAVETPAAPVVAEKPAIAPVEASAPLTGKALADRAVELGLDIDAGRRNLIETGNSMVTKVTQDKVAKLEQGLPPKEPPAAAPAVKETPPEPPKAPAAKVEPKAEPKVESKVETAPAPVVKKPVTKAKGKALATLPPVEAQIVKTKAGTTAAPSAELNKKVSSLSTKKQLDAQKDYLIDAIAKLKEQAPEVPNIKDAKLKAEYEDHLRDIRVYEGKGGAEGKRKVERAIAGINLILRDSGLPKLTIEVPGDGQFTVNNTKRSLASFEGAIAKKFGKGIDPFKSKSNVAVEKFSQLTQAQLDEYKIKRMTEEEAAALDIEMSANETPKKKSK